MVAMSTLNLFATSEIDTKRSTEQCRFDIMRYDCVPSKDDLHIATTNQVRDVATCSGMDDSRAEHKENLTVMCASLFHLACNLMNCEYFDLLCGDSALHKCERFAISGTFKRLNANTIMPNHDLFANLHFVHWFAVSAMIVFIKHNSNIHLDIFYMYPLPIQAHLGR